jgi:hypothetical protein
LKPYLHALISSRKFGGEPSDYIDIHNWFDSAKASVPDARHRLALHHAFGIYLCEQIFGEIILTEDGKFKKMPYITLSNGKKISVRDVAEQHVIDDLGRIPTLDECLSMVSMDEKMVGNVRRLSVSPNAVKIVD